jgi:hypothetical protein
LGPLRYWFFIGFKTIKGVDKKMQMEEEIASLWTMIAPFLFFQKNVIYITPFPILSWLMGFYDRMSSL